MDDQNFVKIIELIGIFSLATFNEKTASCLKEGELANIIATSRMLESQCKDAYNGTVPMEVAFKSCIAFFDKSTEIKLRCFDHQSLSTFVPAELKEAANVAFLRQLGANNLADVCEANSAPKKEARRLNF